MVVGAIAVNIDTVVQRRGKLIAHSLMGLLYISLSLGLLIALLHLCNNIYCFIYCFTPDSFIYPGLLVCLSVIGSMWTNDTMAYIVGSLIGKTPFSKISPKKTWEGTIGGVILCTVIIGFLFSFINHKMADKAAFPDYHWFFIAAIAAIFGTMGDLFESKLKRLAGVKDSGQMMPGHGGFLDRFDSLLLAVPFVWLYVWFFIGR